MLNGIMRQVQDFEADAHEILCTHESASRSRTIKLEQTYKRLQGLSLKQDDLFRQSLACLEHGLYRSAQVMAWAAFMDFIEEKMSEDGYKRLNQVRPNWKKISQACDLREEVSDRQIVETMSLLRLTNKTEEKALIGLLNKRNECAHPSDHEPDLNETLGYVSDLIGRVMKIQPRAIQ